MGPTVRKGAQLNGWGSPDRKPSKHTGATAELYLPGEMLVMWRVFNALQDGLRLKKQSVCLCTLTARSRLLSPCCVRADIDGPRWAFGRLHKVVGALCYERVSGTCLELLSAGKVEFWVIQRLSMSHSLIITLSSIQQVLQTTGRTTLLALFCKYDFIREVSVTSWLINCRGVNKLLGKRI